jgi:hypothetical protein
MRCPYVARVVSGAWYVLRIGANGTRTVGGPFEHEDEAGERMVELERARQARVAARKARRAEEEA